MPDEKTPTPPDYTTKHVRPWGHFRLLDRGPGFVAKAILVKPNQRLSLQRHSHRAERWTVAMGHGVASVDGTKYALAPGDGLFIPVGAVHRLENKASTPLVIIEVWIGDDLREDDIVRIQDDYGRAQPLEGGVVARSPHMLIGDGSHEHVIPLTDPKGGPTIEITVDLKEPLVAAKVEEIKSAIAKPPKPKHGGPA